jgi:GNAT superfamily N-acetyltransferase
MQTFEETILDHWAAHFQCDPSTLRRSGTTLRPDEKYAGRKIIVLWHVGLHTIAVFDPSCSALLHRVFAGLSADACLAAGHIQNALPPGSLASQDVDLIHYLPTADLLAFPPPPSYRVRQLGLPDRQHMAALHDSCTPDEVDNAFIEVDHEIAFGCFRDETLVAAASGYRMFGFMDIGVLTHAHFRKLGLGKVVVAALCAWAVAHDVIAQYRCDARNTASLGVARSLNFQRCVHSENIVLK